MNNENKQITGYATLKERIVAALRDNIYLIWIPAIVYFVIFTAMITLKANNMMNDSLESALRTMNVLVPMLMIFYGQPLYVMIGEMSSRHTSKGKFKSQLYVLNKDGKFLTAGQSFLRMILKYIIFIIPFGLIVSIILIGCTSKKQALHDIILQQVVVKIM